MSRVRFPIQSGFKGPLFGSEHNKSAFMRSLELIPHEIYGLKDQEIDQLQSKLKNLKERFEFFRQNSQPNIPKTETSTQTDTPLVTQELRERWIPFVTGQFEEFASYFDTEIEKFNRAHDRVKGLAEKLKDWQSQKYHLETVIIELKTKLFETESQLEFLKKKNREEKDLITDFERKLKIFEQKEIERQKTPIPKSTSSLRRKMNNQQLHEALRQLEEKNDYLKIEIESLISKKNPKFTPQMMSQEIFTTTLVQRKRTHSRQIVSLDFFSIEPTRDEELMHLKNKIEELSESNSLIMKALSFSENLKISANEALFTVVSANERFKADIDKLLELKKIHLKKISEQERLIEAFKSRFSGVLKDSKEDSVAMQIAVTYSQVLKNSERVFNHTLQTKELFEQAFCRLERDILTIKVKYLKILEQRKKKLDRIKTNLEISPIESTEFTIFEDVSREMEAVPELKF